MTDVFQRHEVGSPERVRADLFPGENAKVCEAWHSCSAGPRKPPPFPWGLVLRPNARNPMICHAEW